MVYEYHKKVKYYETDMMGVVHHSNYIRWFEEARVEFMREADLSYKRMEDERIQIPVVTVSCKYKIPATFDDDITVRTSLKKYNGIVIELAYEVYRDSDGVLLVTGESSHCFVDKDSFKPMSIKNSRPDMHNKFMMITEE